MTPIWILFLACGAAAPSPGFETVRAAFVGAVPGLADASIEVLPENHLRLRLTTRERLAPEACDDLMAAVLTTLPAGSWSVIVVGPEGEDLTPVPLPPEQVERLTGSWRANRPRAAVTLQAPVGPTGALSGLRIALSAGHGLQYASSSWSFQRSLVNNLIEDVHDNEIVFRHLAPMLEAAGADVVLVRERSPYPERVVVDNDGNGTAGTYSEIGTWITGAYPGHGGTYRYAFTAAAGGGRATWQFPIVRPDDLPVYVWYVALDNRSPAAHYEVDHAAGTTVVAVDQRRDDARWHYLGTFPFVPGRPAAVHVDNSGEDTGTMVIADAVRLGGGDGFADFGGGPSHAQRWRQCAAAYAVEEEVPTATLSGTNDVNVRPALALWQGVDLYVAVHTNAGGGSGTSSFVYSNAVAYPGFDPDRSTPVPPGTLALQEAIHSSLMQTFRANWDSAWQDRGMYGADFGELRPLTQAWVNDSHVVVPATLVEIAFHDDPGDAAYLREDRFRADAARAIYRGILNYAHANNPAAAIPTPLPPKDLVAHLGVRGVELSWAATPDPIDPSVAATRYDVEVSRDGWAFTSVRSTADLSVAVNGLSTCETSAFRVVAGNDGGVSQPSRPVFVRVNREVPRLLWVDGDRRLQRTALDRPEGPNTAARMMADLKAAQQGGLIVESARAEAVAQGTVALTDYDAVVWTTGETSSMDSALTSEEQAAIEAYLAAGGALAISGAEIGWDLFERGSAADQSFYTDVLKASFVADAAGTYDVTPASDALWLAGLAAFGFDDGTGQSFRVEYPDVIAPLGNAVAELTYATGGVAAISSAGAGRLFYAGFPLETIEVDGARQDLMIRLVAALLGGAGSVPICGQPYGEPLDDGSQTDGGDSGGGENPGGDADVGGGCHCTASQLPAGLVEILLALGLRRRRRNSC